MTVYIRGFVSNQSQYAYGDFKAPRMHTGTVIITIHTSPGAHSFPFVTQAHLSKSITVCIRGDPIRIRAETATSSHTGSPSTHNEIVPIRGSTYIKCFCTLSSCEWVYGITLSLILSLSLGVSIVWNFGVWTNLSDVGTSWLSLKPHLECFTNPYHTYIKCFCTLISCEWVYGTTHSLMSPWVEGQFSGILGWGPTYLMWLHHGWASNPTWSASQIHIIHI
jgi:hypothetical protein